MTCSVDECDNKMHGRGLCSSHYHREWYRANLEKRKATKHRIRYGMIEGQYAEMLAAQEGMCGICLDASKKLVVDHCHASGNIRALLCTLCNTAIGMLRDDPSRALAAAAYLTQHNALRTVA